MDSVTEICNMALSEVGGNLISSIDDQNQEASLCRANYYVARDALLEDRDWTFAIKRAALPLLQAVPVYEYTCAHQMPSDLIRMISISRDANGYALIDWRREEDHVLSNVSSVFLKYVFRLIDPKSFSSGFKETLALRLAAKLAIPISHSRELRNETWDLAEKRLMRCGASDGMQGKPDILRSDALINARFYAPSIAPGIIA